MKKTLLIIFGVMSVAALQAQLLNVNFADDSLNVADGGGQDPSPLTTQMTGAAAVGSPGDAWNRLSGFSYTASPNGPSFTTAPNSLVYADATTATGITVSLSSPNSTYDANSINWGNYSPFSWTSLGAEQANSGYPGTPYAALMATMITASSGIGTVAISGLTPNGYYNLYTYNASDENETARTSSFTVNGVTQTSTYNGTTATLSSGVDYLEFGGVEASASGVLTINFGTGSSESDFNGFQLEATTQAAPASQWNIVWSDEFNGTSINRSNWTFETGNNGGWGNGELEYYTSSTNNAYVDGNGLLHIAVLQQSIDGYSFTSARMKTEGLYNTPTYGRLQWRAALPAGVGMWPALWLLGSDYSSVGWPACGEIDVVENDGATPDFVQGSLHYGTSGEVSQTATYDLPAGESTTNFHVYVLDWESNSISFSVDGVTYESRSSEAPFNQPFFFIMNVAVGGNYVGNPTVGAIESGATFPQQMLVDYVRVYEKTAPLQISTTTSNGNVVLSWPAGIVCHLQSSTNLSPGGNWSDLTNTTNPFVVAPNGNQPATFYRLESP
jgi:beta-glucanase (GH16 family)